MNLNSLKKFAQGARRKLLAEVASRLDYVLEHDDAYVRSHQEEIGEIRRQLEKKSREQLVEEVAYTWFNRIVALRYMDLRGYHKVRIVSPQAGQVQPELLFQIKQGRTPPEIRSLQTVFDGYLSGTLGSTQPDREIYTTALLGICNDYSRTLPFLFRQVDAYMAVLLPTDLLSESSILSAVQGAIGEEDVTDVEVIGWLYQFYISEKKDQVFGRPKGEKIRKEDIPAATQLFTPHWIVRYMVENSLGRLWRNNRPDTGLKEQMEYYIEGDPEPEYLTIAGPEEITLLDPACGSGHILTYAFDLLYGMYEEAGYSAEEIPSLILTNNLYGIDIDTRAAELASFALTMKAREKDRFFFKRGVVPRVVAMEDVSVDLREAGITMSPQLQEAFGYLTEATNFGSLIPVPAEVQGEIEDILSELDAKGDADLFADQAMAQVRSGLRQLGYLARRYHCVVTNPPYMTNQRMNKTLLHTLKQRYSGNRFELSAVFFEHWGTFLPTGGHLGIINQHVWMFLKSYEELRERILTTFSIFDLLHLGPHAFIDSTGEAVQTCTFFGVAGFPTKAMTVRDAVDLPTEQKSIAISESTRRYTLEGEAIRLSPRRRLLYKIEATKLLEIGRSPEFSTIARTARGLQTGNSDRYIRNWPEVSHSLVFGLHDAPGSRWCMFANGGFYRKWYGNLDLVVLWEDRGRDIIASGKAIVPNATLYDKQSVAWLKLSSSNLGFTYLPSEVLPGDLSPFAVVESNRIHEVLALMNSVAFVSLAKWFSPGLTFTVGAMSDVPVVPLATGMDSHRIHDIATESVAISKADYDSRELSWDFLRSPLLNNYTKEPKRIGSGELVITYLWESTAGQHQDLRTAVRAYTEYWRRTASTLRELEEENNLLFARLYGLDSEVSVGVTYSELTILDSEWPRQSREGECITFSHVEILKQLLSYGVGCIFGRYSLDEDGLILANAGDDLDAYLSQIPDPTLRPDESGILPITDDNDFADDLPSQWRAFLRAAFGDEHYEENLRFLEDGLGKRLRAHFLKGFYDDHVKRYKKRPIYWLITSPNGTLQALIYLHRYNRDTVNRFLNDYLRPYQQKLEAKRVSAEHVLTGGGSSQSEKTKAQKRIDEIRKALEELSTWERDVVRPLAEKRIELDLDDGVKVNYGKLGAILAKVKGLNA